KSEYASTSGAAFAYPVIGGLALSPRLTLVFIPTFYTGLENSISWIRSQNWKIKTVMLTVFMFLIIMIYLNINSFMWQLITTILAIILVPAVTWFVRTSLRKARETVIAEGEPINIVIRSLVKIYERDPRIVREWKAARRIRVRSGMEKEPSSFRDLDRFIWQVPLMGFLVYFTYIYLEKNFWIFFFSSTSWFMLLMIWKPVFSVLKKKRNVPALIRRSLNITVLWLVPLFNLLIFQFKWENPAAVIITGFLWYAGLMIWSTGRYLKDNETDIYRLKGRFRNARKAYYKLVLATPLIGRQRKPFKALGGVSMEIGNGMFGLLGPNGAGKTTLMRIICGILDQSYGKIWINGLDVAEKREELQGLIGYLPQEFGTYENMTAREFLQHQAILKNITETKTRNSRVEYVLRAVHMYERRNEKISSYSGGMKQRIGIAQILLHLPRILVVDEPTAGLDPRERIRFRNLLVELSRERVVIFSTHIIEDISSSCNKVAVLDKGYLKYFGHPNEMTREAEGRVWQFNVPASEFRKVAAEHLVVHHMSEKGSVRIRCISGDKPHENAIEVNPNLEDSYLWLLRKSKIKQT
ncbi:MAG: ATP-binding cassette domain-containing protein, partial [Spirochaetales bacterium]|nr:ATP-binding cassette domain-containing protein [Spirochaetales bacterium]